MQNIEQKIAAAEGWFQKLPKLDTFEAEGDLDFRLDQFQKLREMAEKIDHIQQQLVQAHCFLFSEAMPADHHKPTCDLGAVSSAFGREADLQDRLGEYSKDLSSYLATQAATLNAEIRTEKIGSFSCVGQMLNCITDTLGCYPYLDREIAKLANKTQ